MTQDEAQALVANLSPRQRDVLLFTAKGCTGKEMARLLGCSVSAAAEHAKHMRRKLEVNTGCEASVIAAKAGLV